MTQLADYPERQVTAAHMEQPPFLRIGDRFRARLFPAIQRLEFARQERTG